MRSLRCIKFLGIIIIFTGFLSWANHSYAALTNVSDTVTTSRPSASSPITSTAASGVAQLSIANNNSRFLASDSAKIIKTATTTVVDSGKLIASQSSNLQTIYLANTTSVAANAGADVLMNPVTAMHTVKFTADGITVPVSGRILLTFPALATADANNTASPSASTFQLNGIGTGTIQVWDDNSDITGNVTVTATNPSAGTSPTILLTLDGGTSIAPGSVVTILIGCSASTGAACDAGAEVPRLINPTKSSVCSSTTCTADNRRLSIEAQDASGNLLNAQASNHVNVIIGVIESVLIQAVVDASMTFTIAGVNTGTSLSNHGSSTCSSADTVTSPNSSGTSVDLGTLNTMPASGTVGNIAAQLLTVITNAPTGYSIVASASGPLRNPASGFDITSSKTPLILPPSLNFFGVHACGSDTYDGSTISTTFWNETASDDSCTSTTAAANANQCKYGYPWAGADTGGSNLNIAYKGVGPIGDSGAGEGITVVEYAAGIDASVPGGTYNSVITYIATPIF